MKTFTYYNYIQCIHTLRLNAVLRLAEEGAEYKLEQKNEKNKQDKLVKKILEDEKEMAKFINDFLDPNEKVKSKDLIKYVNNNTTKKCNTKNPDLVYKLKNKEVFFLVEHQQSIDNSITYKILNYCIDIMQEWNRTRKLRIETQYPIIVPTIIYTGNEKWKAPKNIKEKQIADYVLENYKIDLEYNVIEMSKISNKFLLQKRSMFGYGMIIEKSKNSQELKENLELIIKKIRHKEQLENLKDIILYSFEDLLKNEDKENLIKQVELKMKNIEAVTN